MSTRAGFSALAGAVATLVLAGAAAGAGPLATGRLCEQVIVDKRTPDEKMNGYPVARTTTAAGDWVYTLYSKASGEPFVHALNAKGRYALCVDFAWTGTQDDIWLL